MYDITMTTLTYIPWVIMFFYCIITPIVAFAEQDEIIYPLGVSVFFAIIGLIAFVINLIAIP